MKQSDIDDLLGKQINNLIVEKLVDVKKRTKGKNLNIRDYYLQCYCLAVKHVIMQKVRKQ